MTAELMFLILSACLWVGAFLLARAVFAGVRLGLNAPGIDRTALMRTLAISAGVGGLLLLVGSFMPKELGRAADGSWIPIVWIYSPIPGWVLLLGIFMVGSRLIQSRTSLTPDESRSRLDSAG